MDLKAALVALSFASMAVVLFGGAVQAATVEIPLPGAPELLRTQETPLDSLLLPIGPVSGDDVPTRALEGRVHRRSWRIDADLSPLEVLAPIRDALTARGFEEVYACTAQACGGFGFRFGIEVIPAPDMAVNLSNYEFFSAQEPQSGTAVSLLVSRLGGSIYVQVIERHDPAHLLRPQTLPAQGPSTQPVDRDTVQADASAQGAASNTENGLEQALLVDAIKKGGSLSTGALRDVLQLQGHVPLLDLEFDTASAQVGEGPYDSLKHLVTFMSDHESAVILLVGHTDTVGGLQGNIALSERRAASVRERLITRYGVDGARIQVAGAGYMAPLAPNTSEEGREINRRVEAVLVRP